MVNLLPTSERTKLRHEYLIRCSIVGLILFNTVAIVALVMLVPSYLIVQDRLGETKNELTQLRGTTKATTTGQYSSQLKTANRYMKALRPYPDHVPLYTLIQKITSVFSDDVAVTGINYKRSFLTEDNTKKENMTIVLSGKADTRETLVSLEQTLKNLEFIDNVSLPISSLAQKRDVPFSVTLESTF